MCFVTHPLARNVSDDALISEHLPAAPLVPDARADSAAATTEGDGEEGDGAGPEGLLFVVKELPELAGSTDEELAAKFSALGGDKYTILLSNLCFTGCQKYFGAPVRPPYEFSPANLYIALFFAS
jgi:hypothetical protein